jgi:hypothetical protein
MENIVGDYPSDCKSIIVNRKNAVKGIIWLLEIQIKESSNKKKHNLLKNELRHYKKILDKIDKIMLMRYRSDS